MDDRAFGRILDAIYDAATDVARWPIALEHLGAALGGCSYAGLIERSMRSGAGRAVAIGIDAAGQREYFEVWSRRDVLRQWLPSRVGTVETDQDILPRAALLRSDYYNGFMKPRDMHAVMRLTLSHDDGIRRIISLSRPRSRGDYEAADMERCRILLPHLQRAARTMQRIEQAQLMVGGVADLLEQSTRGVVLLDRAGRVVFANRAAQALGRAGDGLVLRHDRIAAHSPRDAALQRIVAGATRRADRLDAARGGALHIARRSGGPDLAVVVAPLPGAGALTETGPVAAVLITDPDAAATGPDALLRELFGLSRAEARVAARLMRGEGPEQAAAALGIKPATARWHLAALYRKTGTNRQAQLVQRLLSLPWI